MPKKIDTENLNKKISDLEKKNEELLEQLKRLQADFDNLKKISFREKKQTEKIANERLISELLRIIDDFERALCSVKNKDDFSGIEMIYENFTKILKDFGLKRIEAEGKKFDPYYHEVLLKEPSEKEEDMIIEELQKGYILDSKVIRHSKVKISSGKN